MVTAHVQPLERRVLLAVNPAGFVQTTFASNIARPTAMEFAPDGRLFVAQQGGALRVIKDGQLLPDPSLPGVEWIRAGSGAKGDSYDQCLHATAR